MKRHVVCAMLGIALAAAIVPAVSTAGATVRPAAFYDESEPNNSPLYANAISAFGSGHNYHGTIGPSDPYDYFWFYAEQNHTYRISVGAEPADIYIDPSLKFGHTHPWSADSLHVDMNADNQWLDGRDAVVDWTCWGSESYRFAIYSASGQYGNWEMHVEDMGAVATATPHVIGGADRYAVAAAVARKRFPTYYDLQYCIVASGLDRSCCDALCSAPLAGDRDAPILLINQDSGSHTLPAATRNVLRQMQTENAGAPVQFYLVGGTPSVPTWVTRQIRRYYPAATFRRLGGADRYACAANIAAEVRIHQLPAVPERCFIANGETPGYFYDALAISPRAFSSRWPMLLTRKAHAPAATLAEVANYAEKVVVGDFHEVSGNVDTELGAGASRLCDPLPYYDRCRQARWIAEVAERQAWMSTGNQPVYTNKLSDALTGGTLAGSMAAPLLYAYSATRLDAPGRWTTDEWTQVRREIIAEYYVVGGPPSMGPGVTDRLEFLTGQTTP